MGWLEGRVCIGWGIGESSFHLATHLLSAYYRQTRGRLCGKRPLFLHLSCW